MKMSDIGVVALGVIVGMIAYDWLVKPIVTPLTTRA
jgi:hypothetical protein